MALLGERKESFAGAPADARFCAAIMSWNSPPLADHRFIAPRGISALPHPKRS